MNAQLQADLSVLFGISMPVRSVHVAGPPGCKDTVHLRVGS